MKVSVLEAFCNRKGAMGLTDPVAVFNAETNMEAVVVCEALVASGIEAHVVEDASPAGMWMFGPAC